MTLMMWSKQHYFYRDKLLKILLTHFFLENIFWRIYLIFFCSAILTQCGLMWYYIKMFQWPKKIVIVFLIFVY